MADPISRCDKADMSIVLVFPLVINTKRVQTYIYIVTSKHGRVDSELSRFLKIAQLDDRTAAVSTHSDGRGWVG